jgi:hypothetical protein
MKKTIAVFGVLACLFAVRVGAQQDTSTIDAYLKWKAQALANLPADTPHYCLVAIPQRLDGNSAKIDFLAVGKMRGFSLDIQPLRITKNADGKYFEEKVGGITKNTVQGQREIAGKQSTLRSIIPITNETNGFEIRWQVDREDGEMNNTITIWLDGAQSGNVLGLVPSQH